MIREPITRFALNARRPSSLPKFLDKIMNAIGAMRGPNVTAKGEAMQKKHEADMSKFTGEAHNFDFKRPKRKVLSRYKR